MSLDVQLTVTLVNLECSFHASCHFPSLPLPKAGKDVALMARWRHCAISSQRLRQPVVACGVGKLYNKEAVIEALLDRSKMPGDAAHIKSLKVGITLMDLHTYI